MRGHAVRGALTPHKPSVHPRRLMNRWDYEWAVNYSTVQPGSPVLAVVRVWPSDAPHRLLHVSTASICQTPMLRTDAAL